MGFPERFNRYYTDPTWKPSRTIYVSSNGSGDGTSRGSPMSVQAAIKAARPGTQIHFVRGNYQGCFELSKANSGTYDEPVVLYAERNQDQSIGVRMTCCNSGRQTCFNLENADYVAVDGFELIGGRFGVRAVGAGYPASQHSRGIAVHQQQRPRPGERSIVLRPGRLGSVGRQRRLRRGEGRRPRHLSQQRRRLEHRAIQRDVQQRLERLPDQSRPGLTCKEVGIPYNDPRCDAYAGTGEGGQGASDYFLIDSNYFHHGAGNGSARTSPACAAA